MTRLEQLQKFFYAFDQVERRVRKVSPEVSIQIPSRESFLGERQFILTKRRRKKS